MPVKICKVGTIPKMTRANSGMFQKMVEWKRCKNLVLDSGVPADGYAKITLGEESLALSKSKSPEIVIKRFVIVFKYAYPPDEYRYRMTIRKGAIYLVNNPRRTGGRDENLHCGTV